MWAHYFKDTNDRVFQVLDNSNVLVAGKDIAEKIDSGDLCYCDKDGDPADTLIGVKLAVIDDKVSPLLVRIDDAGSATTPLRESTRPIMIVGEQVEQVAEKLGARACVCNYVG